MLECKSGTKTRLNSTHMTESKLGALPDYLEMPDIFRRLLDMPPMQDVPEPAATCVLLQSTVAACRRSLASRPEVVNSLQMDRPVQQLAEEATSSAGRTDAEEWSHQIKHEEHEVVLLPVEATKLFLDFRPYMNSAPLAVRRRLVAARVHHIFQSLGLRHLAVVEPRGYVVGIITRKDLGRAAVAGAGSAWEEDHEGSPQHVITQTMRNVTSRAQGLIRQISNLSLPGLSGEAQQPPSDYSESRSDCSSSPHWKPNARQRPANIDIRETYTAEPQPPVAEASFNEGIADIDSDRHPPENGHAEDANGH